MVKKQSHKIFNLIIMIIGIFAMFSVLNVSYVYGDVMYSADQDYVAEEESIPDDSGTMWSNINVNEFFGVVRGNVAKWYQIFRYIAIAIMLIILVVLAIRLAFASLAPKKALYKKMLIDWLVCFILLFFSHYFMILIQYLNESLIKIFKIFSDTINTGGKYNLYETVKSRAYDIKFTVGFSGMILYITLVYLTIKYAYIYSKRFILLVILTIIAPITMLFYSVQKILTGKSKVFTKWMEEYAINVLLQAIHALTYTVFVGTALKLTETSLIGFVLSFVFLNFMSKADKLFRRIFKFSDGSSMAEEIANSQISELKDNIATAYGAYAIAKKTNIGQKVGSLVSSGATMAAIGAANLVKNSNFGNLQMVDAAGNPIKGQTREEYEQRRMDEYKDKIAEAQDKMNKANEVLNDPNLNLSDEDRALFKNIMKQAEEDERKYTRRYQRYVYRRGIFERLRDALDYDNYTEYVEDPDGDFEEEDVLDEEGNPTGEKTIVPSRNGTGKKYKRRLIRSKTKYNAETGQFEKIGGITKKFSKKKDDILGLSKEHKALIQEAKDMMKDQVLGFGGLILGMGTFIDNPTLGFSLLAIGGAKVRKLTKEDESIKLNRRTKRVIRDIMRRKDKEYKHAKFTTGSILSIDDTIKDLTRTDIDVESINHAMSRIKNRKLRLVTGFMTFIPRMQFRALGARGFSLNVLSLTRKMAKQHMEDIKQYERSVDVELMKAIADKLREANLKYIESISKYITEKNLARMMYETRLKDGTIVISKNGKEFAFNSEENMEVLSPISRVRQAIIETALNNYIYDLSEFNINNTEIRNDLIANLKKYEIIKKHSDEEYDIDKILDGETILEEKSSFVDLGTKFVQSEAIKKSERIYIVNLQESVNSGLYKSGKAIVEPVQDVTVEQFAEAIAGKGLIGRFNGFEIDGEKFKSAQDIIDAYYKTRITNQTPIISWEKEDVEEKSISKDGAKNTGNNRKSTQTEFIIDPAKKLNIEEFAKEIVGKNIIAQFNGIEIDASKYATTKELVDAYFEASQRSIVDNTNLNTENIKYTEELLRKVGVESYITIMDNADKDVLKKKVYEKVVKNYIERHEIKSPNKLKNPNVQNRIKELYEKELKKDSVKRAMVRMVAKSKKDFSKVTSQDIISVATQNDIEQFRYHMFAKMSSSDKNNDHIFNPTDIAQEKVKDMVTGKLNELNTVFDKVILGALANHGILDASAVDLNNANTADLSSLKADILNLLRMQGLDNSAHDLIAIAQSRIDSITSDEIENTIISKLVADFIVEKCDSDPNKLKESEELTNELNEIILKKIDELGGSSSEEQESTTDSIIELLGDKKREQSDVQQSVTGANYVFDKIKEENEDSDLDISIPFPVVETNVAYDVIYCNFSIPPGIEDVKIETCVKEKTEKETRFMEIEEQQLSDPKKIVCARLSRGEKHGPTLIINYPEETIDIVSKIQDKVADSVPNKEMEDDVKKLEESVLSNLTMLDVTATPEDVFGQENMKASESPEIERLFKNREISKAQSITLDVLERLNESKTSMVKPEESEAMNNEIRDAILNNDFALGMRADYDTDSEEFAEFRKASTRLLNTLLQMKIVDEDADSLKMNNDSKNSKKFRKAKQSVLDNLKVKEDDVNEIIQTIYNRRGG